MILITIVFVGEMLKIRMRTADAEALRERAKQQDTTVSAVVHRALGFEPLVSGGKREGAGRPVTKKLAMLALATVAKKTAKRAKKRVRDDW